MKLENSKSQTLRLCSFVPTLRDLRQEIAPNIIHTAIMQRRFFGIY